MKCGNTTTVIKYLNVSYLIYLDGTWNSPDCWIPEELENGSLSVAPNNHTVAAVEEFWK